MFIYFGVDFWIKSKIIIFMLGCVEVFLNVVCSKYYRLVIDKRLKLMVDRDIDEFLKLLKSVECKNVLIFYFLL